MVLELGLAGGHGCEPSPCKFESLFGLFDSPRASMGRLHMREGVKP